MAVDGTYLIEIDTPMGKMEEKFILATKGNVLTGKTESQMGAHDIKGTVNGNKFSWDSDISSPMGQMRLTITGEVVGDAISGEVKAGDFGTSPFRGKRV